MPVGKTAQLVSSLCVTLLLASTFSYGESATADGKVCQSTSNATFSTLSAATRQIRRIFLEVRIQASEIACLSSLKFFGTRDGVRSGTFLGSLDFLKPTGVADSKIVVASMAIQILRHPFGQSERAKVCTSTKYKSFYVTYSYGGEDRGLQIAEPTLQNVFLCKGSFVSKGLSKFPFRH